MDRSHFYEAIKTGLAFFYFSKILENFSIYLFLYKKERKRKRLAWAWSSP
jgi:hypothetical protein